MSLASSFRLQSVASEPTIAASFTARAMAGMDELGILLLIALAALIAATPFVSIINAVVQSRRHRRLKFEVDALLNEVERLRRDVRGLREGAAPPAGEGPRAKDEGRKEVERAAAGPGPVAGEPPRPIAPEPAPDEVERPQLPADAAKAPRHFAPPPPPPPRRAEAIAQKLEARAEAPSPSGAPATSEPTTGPPSGPPGPPPPRPPAIPPLPKIDWEAMLGVRLAAWIGAVALAFAGILFAKWSIEQGLITPAMRFGLLIAAGLGSLVGAEFVLRKGYETTANALCGAGVAILYVGLYTGHALYGLVSMPVTFGLMVLVTVVAGLMAIRYNAMFIAVLGLLGGFATPIALSTGVDRPIGLFSYILLLNLGVLWICARKGWNVLAMLAVAGTLLIEALWTGKFLEPEKLLIGLVAYGGFGLLYLALPRAARQGDLRMMLRTAVVGGLAPFVFAFYIAGNREFADGWPLLFGFIALLGGALGVVALRRGQAYLMLAAAIASGVTIVLWGMEGLRQFRVPSSEFQVLPWGPGLAAIAIVLLHNYLPRMAARIGPKLEAEVEVGERKVRDAAGIVMGVALIAFGFELIAARLGEPPWVFLCLIAGLSVVAFERSRPSFFERAVAIVGPLAIALLTQVWFFAATRAETLTRNLAVPVLLGIAWTAIALARLARRPEPDLDPATARAHGLAGACATLVAVTGLFWIVGDTHLATTPGPLFASLAALSVLLIVLATRGREWPALLVIGVTAAGSLATLWYRARFREGDPAGGLLAIAAAFYLVWLALPFVVPARLVPQWTRSPWPWLASALSGPLHFYVIYKIAVHLFGDAYIGALPVAMAALSLAGLAEVKRRYVPTEDPALAKQRLRNLSLFAAVALGFVSVAIPLQLERQWITIGWALEAMAVWWLYGRLPHPGLKYFGVALYAAVGVRLLANDAVLRYAERGWPVLNWILYTYGVAAVCCLVGAALLKAVEEPRLTPAERRFFGPVRFAPLAGFLGLVIVFALINLEIADYYSTDRYVETNWRLRGTAFNLTLSIAWGIYGIVLLVVGIWRRMRPLRIVALGFIALTVCKVFLYDLRNLTGLYRSMSFLGLAISLIIVSLLYQRFVFRKDAEHGSPKRSDHVPDQS